MMNKRGYTLIEMAVVVLLVGIMVGVAVPKVKDTITGDRLKKTTRQLIGLSRVLRNDAAREQVDYELHLSMDRRSFWRYSVDTTPEKRIEVEKRAFRLPEGVRIKDVQIFGEGKKSRGDAVILFFKKGYMQPAVIHLSDGEKNMTLIFNPFIHRVETHDDYVDIWQTTAALPSFCQATAHS